ncbi:MAG: PASTA domain-containing protein, partial [Bacteroidales bacterium]|nr:PASTA domain-containing protein [Bacteroidales bacterium]
SDNPVILSGRGDNLSVLLSVMPSATQFPVKGGAWVTMQKDSTGVNLQEIRFPADTVPDVMGMGLRDALYLLENMGYTVRFQGAGKVTSQNFSPAVSTISRGVINLKLSESYETE